MVALLFRNRAHGGTQTIITKIALFLTCSLTVVHSLSLTLSHFVSTSVLHFSSHSGSRKHCPRSVFDLSRWQSLRGTAEVGCREERRNKREPVATARVSWKSKQIMLYIKGSPMDTGVRTGKSKNGTSFLPFPY